MTTPWRKVGRDFWLGRARAVWVVAAIALGIAAFQAVMSTYAILARELNRGYLATQPASATLWTEGLDDELLRAVAAFPGIAAAEARRAVPARIKTGPGRWRGLTLFVVRDYTQLRLSTITPEGGAWPPGRGEMLIERDAFQVAKAKLGDTVTIKMPQGAIHTLRVTGRVHDVGQAQARMENTVYGYITLDTLALLGEEPRLDQLKLLVAEEGMNREHITQVVTAVKGQIEAGGHTVWRVEITTPGKHPHADLMGTLLLAISSFGLLVLALSGVLVVNLLSAMMAAEVRQIGVMKAIGGTTRQIAAIYFGQALLLGAAAVLVALPLGMAGARALCGYLAGFLNFDLASFAVPWWVYALVALVGGLTPLLAAAFPVWKGSRVSVGAALVDFGVTDRGFGAGPLDRALTRVGGLTRPLLLAVRNSFRRRARLALTLATLTVAGLFFLSALNVRLSMIRTLDDLFATKRYDLSLNLGSMVPSERVEKAVAQTPGGKGMEAWIYAEGSVVSSDESPVGKATTTQGHRDGAGHSAGSIAEAPRFPVLGLPPGTPLLALSIAQGRDLAPGDVDVLVANTALLNRYPQIRVGESVRLRFGTTESSWLVVGVAQEAFSPALAYVPRTFFDRAGGHEGLTNSARVRLERQDLESVDQFRDALDRNLEALGLRGVTATSTAESRFGFDQHMVMIYLFLIVMSAILGGVGGLGLSTTLSLNVLERRREMGVLRAIGASSRMVWLIVVTEGLAIGAMSFTLAALAAGPLSRALGNFVAASMFKTELRFAFDWNGLWIWLTASLTLAALASFFPAWKAARAPVREALGFE